MGLEAEKLDPSGGGDEALQREIASARRLVGDAADPARTDEVTLGQLETQINRRIAGETGLLARMRALPGVAAVAAANSVPFGEFHEGPSVERVGGPARADVAAHSGATFRIVGAGYFKTLNLPMVRGREFTESEEHSPTAPRVAIIDERLARKLFGADDPLGQMIRYSPRPGESLKNDTEPMEVVGIAPPVRDELFDREAAPAIYEAWGRNYRASLFLHVRTGQAGTEADLLATIRREMMRWSKWLK